MKFLQSFLKLFLCFAFVFCGSVLASGSIQSFPLEMEKEKKYNPSLIMKINPITSLKNEVSKSLIKKVYQNEWVQRAVFFGTGYFGTNLAFASKRFAQTILKPRDKDKGDEGGFFAGVFGGLILSLFREAFSLKRGQSQILKNQKKMMDNQNQIIKKQDALFVHQKEEFGNAQKDRDKKHKSLKGEIVGARADINNVDQHILSVDEKVNSLQVLVEANILRGQEEAKKLLDGQEDIKKIVKRGFGTVNRNVLKGNVLGAKNYVMLGGTANAMEFLEKGTELENGNSLASCLAIINGNGNSCGSAFLSEGSL